MVVAVLARLYVHPITGLKRVYHLLAREVPTLPAVSVARCSSRKDGRTLLSSL